MVYEAAVLVYGLPCCSRRRAALRHLLLLLWRQTRTRAFCFFTFIRHHHTPLLVAGYPFQFSPSPSMQGCLLSERRRRATRQESRAGTVVVDRTAA